MGKQEGNIYVFGALLIDWRQQQETCCMVFSRQVQIASSPMKRSQRTSPDGIVPEVWLSGRKRWCGGPVGMIRFRRKTYLAAAFCLVGFACILTLSYFWSQNSSLPKRMVRRGENICKGRLASGSISALSDNRTFVIAPYLDYRLEKVTRIIGIAHHEDVRPFYCWFCCPARDEAYISKALVAIHSDRFGFPYATADFLCLETADCEPHYVALHRHPREGTSPSLWFEIKNRRAETYPVEFTLCISTMFGGYNNVLQFIQSLEMYKLLGVQKVVIYKTSCGPLMENVLEFYVAEGMVEIVPWPITAFLNVSTEWRFKENGTQIGYYGQIPALNDCVYRNMYKSRYVLLNDIDEIILPVQYPDWKALMRRLQEQNPQAGVFLFESHVFPNNVFASDDVPSWGAVPGVDILQHVLREPDRKEVLNPRKMIVNPRKVVQTSVHSVLEALGESVDVPMEVAMVYHCRTPFQPYLGKGSLIRDTTLWRYNSSLVHAVSQVLRKIPL
ncbi:hypothetical protein lerEdw1_011240 [Lerista edwardsae]|nr:hypothetical protein lerEdw1_011240 [Lerista edwardsae]